MKILKLINNERKQIFANSKNGCGIDECYADDTAYCQGSSNDICKYDRGACGNGIDDRCDSNIVDWNGCTILGDDMIWFEFCDYIMKFFEIQC